MNQNDDGPAVYIYGLANAAILIARIGIIGAAAWTAIKPGGSILMAIFIFLLSTFMTPIIRQSD